MKDKKQDRQDRPASRARQFAAGGIRTPEETYRACELMTEDILLGALDSRDSNGACRAITTKIAVARNADLLSDMAGRADMAARERGVDEEEAKKERRKAELLAELAALDGRG